MTIDEITEETDCTSCAGQNPRPSEEMPLVALPPIAERNDLLDSDAMTDKLDEYESTGAVVVERHQQWRLHFDLWATRADKLYAQTVVIERSLGRPLGAVPAADFEEFQLVNLGTFLGGTFATVTALYGLFTAGKQLHAVYKLDAVSRVRKFSYGALGVASLGLAAISAYATVRNIKDRTDKLIDALPAYHEWLYGKDENSGELIPANQVSEFNGAAGEIQAMIEAVDAIQDRIRDLAPQVGVALNDSEEKPKDLEVVYCEIVKALDLMVRTAAQVEAAFDVATRMLCLDENDDTASYTDNEIATATGLSEFVIANRREQVKDEEQELCDN